MLLQHAVKYHEARDCICLQDHHLTYKLLLSHCKFLKLRCEQFLRAQVKGQTELTTLTFASSMASSVHQDAITTNTNTNAKCFRCGYTPPCTSCPAFGKECCNCCGTGHFTTLCRKPRSTRISWCRDSTSWSIMSSSQSCRLPSCSMNRGSQSSQSLRCRPSTSHTHHRTPYHMAQTSSAPYRQQVSHITLISSQSSQDGKLITDTASDGHTSFHTTLQIITSQGSKPLHVKVDPGSDVNTMPLS